MPGWSRSEAQGQIHCPYSQSNKNWFAAFSWNIGCFDSIDGVCSEISTLEMGPTDNQRRRLHQPASTEMKGSEFTGKTWLLLIVAALLIAAGVVNFSQRLSHQPPAWDGVTWMDTAQGVVAKTVAPGSAAAKAQINAGDHLIAIS